MSYFTPQLIEAARAYYLKHYGITLSDDEVERYLLTLANVWVVTRRVRNSRRFWASLDREEDRPARAKRGRRSS